MQKHLLTTYSCFLYAIHIPMFPVHVDSKDKWLAAGLLAFVVVVILFAFFILSSRYKTAPIAVDMHKAPTPTPTKTMIESIMYTGKAFVPPQVTIHTGGQVSLLNFADAAVSVVSDDPKNPEMNMGTVVVGDTKIITFTKPGAYMYHNAAAPEQKGVIIVQ